MRGLLTSIINLMTYDVIPFSPTVMYREGQLDIVMYLTSEQHCNMACSDKYGWTPLHLACQ